MYTGAPEEVRRVRPGASVTEIKRILGKPALALDEFALATDIDKTMVGMWRMELSLAALMWRYRGWRVWINYAGDTVTHVAWRKYGDW